MYSNPTRNINFNHKYLTTFFAEKDVPERGFEIDTDDGFHIIPNVVVLEHIAITSKGEKDAIASVIRKIDFANGDVNDFLRHLAGAIAANYEA